MNIEELAKKKETIKKYLYDIINKYRDDYGKRLINPLEMAINNNIIVNKANLDVESENKKVLGFYYYKVDDYIYIDEKASSKEKRFIVAHELGHYFLQKPLSKDDGVIYDFFTGYESGGNVLEELANCFAKELLLPDKEFREEVSYYARNVRPIQDLSDRFDVEPEIVRDRIKELGLSKVINL